MKNQLCKPCDYRRAFRLRFKFPPKYIPLSTLEYGYLLSSFKRHWPVRPAQSNIVPPNAYLQEWRFRPWCEYWPIWFFYKMKWYYKCGGDKILQPW